MLNLELNGVTAGGYTLPIELSARGNVSLELKYRDDPEEVFALIDNNRDHIYKYMPWFGARTVERVVYDSEFLLPAMINQGRVAAYRILHRNVYVGEVDLNKSTTKHAELGYWIAKDSTGQGVATRAAETLVDFGLNDWGLDSIDIRIHPDNSPSIAVAERLGANMVELVQGFAQGVTTEYEIWRLEK